MVLYSAVVLDENSRKKLIGLFKKDIPDNWEIIAHHMTINMGNIDTKLQQFLGREVNIIATTFAMDDKVAAVGVSGFNSANKTPHITLAVNREAGGKPVMSNNLTNWEPIGRPIILRGVVTEVTRN